MAAIVRHSVGLPVAELIGCSYEGISYGFCCFGQIPVPILRHITNQDPSEGLDTNEDRGWEPLIVRPFTHSWIETCAGVPPGRRAFGGEHAPLGARGRFELVISQYCVDHDADSVNNNGRWKSTKCVLECLLQPL
jgi:hypothetical protein